MNEKEIAKIALKKLKEILETIENDGAVYQALEICRYALEDIAGE